MSWQYFWVPIPGSLGSQLIPPAATMVMVCGCLLSHLCSSRSAASMVRVAVSMVVVVFCLLCFTAYMVLCWLVCVGRLLCFLVAGFAGVDF